MDFLVDGPNIDLCAHGISLSRPLKSENLKIRDSAPRRRARELPVVAPFSPAWSWDAEAETARETENLVAWGGDSGRGPARGEGDRRCRRARGGGISEIWFFRKRRPEIFGEWQKTTEAV
jgi:hypothetical protein